MRKISIVVGIIGLIVIGWFLFNKISIDYIATVDDELSKLELELAALETEGLSAADVAAAKNKISSRLGTIQTSLSASEEGALTVSQQQLLNEGLLRLQTVLSDHRATLVALDQASGDSPASDTEANDTAIALLSQTIGTIQQYLDMPSETLGVTPQNTTYSIDGTPVTLIDGVAVVEEVPGGATRTETTYFGNEVRTDLNNDGEEDIVFLLTQNTGGSGTFFYVVAALYTEDGWTGSQGFLLGDRIAPQTTEMSQDPNHQNVIVVNYADRETDQPMTEAPTVGKSVWLKLDLESMTFGEVEQNFSGEADPNTMTLDMKPWTWVKTTYSDDTELVPNQPEAFTLTFTDQGTFSATTDCNAMGGTYQVTDNTITFGPIMATKMFCEGSQESDFAAMLGEVQSFFFTPKGELIFALNLDTGTVTFR